MDRKRLLELSGQIDLYADKEVLEEMHLGMSHVKAIKKDNTMKEVHHKKGHKSDDTEPKATHAKKVGGKVEKKDNVMDRLNKTTTTVTEMAQQIVDSGDVEGWLRELIVALQEAGVEL